MLTPDDISKRASRKYRDVLRAWLAGEVFTPIEYPVGGLSKNLAERRQQIETLREQSYEAVGFGYRLLWDTINTQSLGTQTMPRRIVIETLDDYLGLLRRLTEFNHFVADVQKIRHKFPSLEEWMQLRPQDIIEHHGKWDDLLIVCDYFVDNPRPDVYIRELPIAVHTKFIEWNQRILRELFEVFLPETAIDRDIQDFTGRFGLKDKPSLVRLRLLEEQLDWLYSMRINELSLPVDQLAHLLAEHIKPRRVLIVENLINFLTLPKIPNGIGIFGGGFAVHLLRNVTWLNQCDVIYWGDIDSHGFEILSDLRGLFPHVRSLMMDQETLEKYAEYVGRGVRSRLERFSHLTNAEALLVQDVVENNWRLEQEHIHQDYVNMRLKQLLLESPNR
ncbi:MAG: DUF2220 family protein [Aggregatilineales bacterium]